MKNMTIAEIIYEMKRQTYVMQSDTRFRDILEIMKESPKGSMQFSDDQIVRMGEVIRRANKKAELDYLSFI